MSRLPDWEERFADFIAANRERPFEWGQWDCALFATAAAAAITGEDRAAAFRGTYATRKGSADALRKLGKGTLLKTLDSLFERKPAPFAMRGDLVWFSGSVGICIGADALFVGEERLHEKLHTPLASVREGLVTIARPLWSKAWGV